MPNTTIDLACNVAHALRIWPPNYVRSVFGDPDSWFTKTCPPTELKLAEPREWRQGLPELAYILIPALPWKPPGLPLPFSDLLFRPSVVFRYPAAAPDQNPGQRWFFINGICTDRSVVRLNAAYLHRLFGRPLTVLHNFTRGILPDLAACAVGKEWDRVTESVAVAFPHVYAALKDRSSRRVIVLAHSQGTILSAVMLHLLTALHPEFYDRWVSQAEVAPEHAVARKLARRWDFESTMRPAKTGAESCARLPAFGWPGHGRRQPEPVTEQELRKLEFYCFANCATEMRRLRFRSRHKAPWIESYGNANDIVARLGVLANTNGCGRVQIAGDRYERAGAWGHLLNAHYLFPMMEAHGSGDPKGGLAPLNRNLFPTPRLFDYLQGKTPPPL